MAVPARPPSSIGDPADIEKLAELLVRSERPAVLLGTQVWTCRGHEAATSLFKALNVPCYMNGAARGVLPPGDPHYFNRTRADAFNEADVIVIVGTPFDFRMGYGRRLRADATVVHIDMDYRTVAKNRDVGLGLVGDPGAIMKAVHAAVGERPDNGAEGRAPWLAHLRGLEGERAAKLMPLFLSDASPIHPYRVAWELNEFLTEDTIYIGDGGDVVTISAQAVEPRAPGNWMDPGALGALGVGTGFALASKLVHPDKEVLCYYGDGSFGMTAFDMETANRFGAPYIAVIGNNSAMNQIRYGQLSKYGDERGNVGNLLGDVPFSKFAEMLGGYGEEVTDCREIGPALRPGPGIGADLRQVGRRQHLGGRRRMGPRNQTSDHVQVATNHLSLVRETHGKGTLRHSHPGHDPRPGRTHFEPAHGLSRRGRHQARIARGGRHPQAAPGHSGRGQPLFHHAELQQALHHGEPEECPGQGSLHPAGAVLRRDAGKLRPGGAGPSRIRLGEGARVEPPDHHGLHQGLRQRGALRRLQGL